MALWGTQRLMTKDHPRDFSRGKTIGIRVGEPMYPDGTDPVAETEELHKRLQTLVDEAIDAYPAEEQPPGSWWLPASRGGSAPTPAARRGDGRRGEGPPGCPQGSAAGQDDDPASVSPFRRFVDKSMNRSIDLSVNA